MDPILEKLINGPIEISRGYRSGCRDPWAAIHFEFNAVRMTQVFVTPNIKSVGLGDKDPGYTAVIQPDACWWIGCMEQIPELN